MKRVELIKTIAEKTGYSQKNVDVKAGNETNIQSFGTFKSTFRAAKIGCNPKTGEKIQIKERKAFVFKSAKELKSL